MTEIYKSTETIRNRPDAESTPPNSGLPRKSRWWIWALAIVVVLAAVLIYRQRQAADAAKANVPPPTRGVPVLTTTAKKGDVGIYAEELGIVTPVYTVTVTSRVQGEIQKVYYTEGQMVRKGDPLIDIDPRPYQAALAQAEGQLAHDQALLSEAKIDYDRYQAAYARNAIAQQQVADQEQTVRQYEGTVKNDEGNLDNAKVNLVYTHITAPIDGRVGLRLVDPGNIVQANSTTALVVITQLQPITVIFSVAEDLLSQIQPQVRKGVRMKVDALDHWQKTMLASGYLLTLDNEVDTTTATVRVKAQFDNRDGLLFPNQFVNIRLLLRTLQDATLVPTQAVQQGSLGSFVYIIKSGDTAVMQAVKIQAPDGSDTAVDSVQPGDVVATSGFDKLQDGAKVTVSKGNGPGQTQSSSPGATGQGQAPNTGQAASQGQGQSSGQGHGPSPTGHAKGSTKP